MPWKCRICGDANEDHRIVCKAAGHVQATLVLTSEKTGRSAEFNIAETKVGQSLLTAIVGREEAKCASVWQFEVVQADYEGWLLQHGESATNQTFVDGDPIGKGGVLLESGSVITVGPKGRVRLVASFKHAFPMRGAS